MFSLKTYMAYLQRRKNHFPPFLLLLLLFLLFLFLNDEGSMLQKKYRDPVIDLQLLQSARVLPWILEAAPGTVEMTYTERKTKEHHQVSVRAVQTCLRVPASSEKKEIVPNVFLCGLVLPLLSSALPCGRSFHPRVRAASSELTLL